MKCLPKFATCGLIFCLASSLAWAGSWPDSMELGGRRHAVPEMWVGLRMGPDEAPVPDDLAALPDSLCTGDVLYLRRGARDAFAAMAEAAFLEGHRLRANSAYRSVATQRKLIEKRLALGRELEDILWDVAPPGFSEHMLGTVVDLEFGGLYRENPAYQWMLENAARFGFVESYPYDPVQPYPWEPWHWRWREIPEEEPVRGK